MAANIIPLVELFGEVPDFRQASGKRYPLAAILALACAAMLCGYRSYSAIAEWGRNYGRELMTALGFPNGKTPCASTLHWIFRHLDCAQFESKLSQWAEQVLASQPPTPEQAEGIAVDGKTLRGSQKQGAPGSHLLSALSHRLGITLAQHAVADKSNELFRIEDVLEALVLTGRIVTTDALHTQRYVAQTILDGDGDYVMLVKGNQPDRLAHIRRLCQERAVVAETLTVTATVAAGHGRIEVRRLTASSALADYLDWPGLQQVFEIARPVTRKRTGRVRHETVYGITCTAPSAAQVHVSPVCRRRAPTRPGYSTWSSSTGPSRTKRLGCAMSPSMQIARKSGVAASRKSWRPCAIWSLASCASTASPTSPQPVVALPLNLGPL